jgi:hypothetical protein
MEANIKSLKTQIIEKETKYRELDVKFSNELIRLKNINESEKKK